MYPRGGESGSDPGAAVDRCSATPLLRRVTLTTPDFALFGAAHLTALLVILVAALALCRMPRAHRCTPVAVTLAALLLAQEAGMTLGSTAGADEVVFSAQ